MQIPFLNIKSQYLSIKNEIDKTVERVFQSGRFIGGDEVKSFENMYASYLGVKHVISTGNGTDSLFAALKVLNIGPGDEVLTPAWSWISTSETVSLTGATPVFADVDPNTFNISIADVKKKISSKTKAILAVHLYGQCCDVTELESICEEHNLILVEDCAQAHGEKHNGKLAGTFGIISSFSFYPTKNLGAFGDAGCMVTKDDKLATNLRRFVNHGGLNKDEHFTEGMNSRLDTLQAAILSVKLSHLEKWNNRRKEIANQYIRKLSSIDWLTLPATGRGNRHVFHLFVVRCKKRNALKSFLESCGISTMIHYPKALPFEPAYSRFNFKESDFPVAAQLQDEVLSLPCYPEMTDEMVEYICSMISKFQF